MRQQVQQILIDLNGSREKGILHACFEKLRRATCPEWIAVTCIEMKALNALHSSVDYSRRKMLKMPLMLMNNPLVHELHFLPLYAMQYLVRDFGGELCLLVFCGMFCC